MEKILFIHHSSSWGGSIKSLIELVNSLDKKKFNPTVFLIKDSEITEVLKNKNINYVLAKSKFYLKYYRYFTHSEAGYVKWYQIIKLLKLSILWLLSRYVFAENELSNIDYDIVHLNSSTLTDWLAPCKSKGKTIIHIREPFRNGKLNILSFFFRKQMKLYADRIIAISKDNARRIKLPKKTTVIYDNIEYSPTKIYDKSYFSRTFLYLGGSSKIKGFYQLVNSLKYLDKNIKIIFAGNYSYLNNNNQFVKIIKKIIFYDFKQKKAIREIKKNKKASIFGLVYDVGKLYKEVCGVISPFYKPHFSLPVIEANLYKKPSIGSDVEGMEEIIKHQKTGLLYSNNDSKELASAINYIANHPEEAKKMGEEGFRIAKTKFTSANSSQVEKIYLKLVQD